MAETLLSCYDLSLAYAERQVLAGAEMAVSLGESVAILGVSGSGKSTFLRVVSGIELPDSGVVSFDGRSLLKMSDVERSALRLSRFGFVFQFGDLVPELTVEENIALPLEFLGRSRREIRSAVDDLIDRLRLEGCAKRRPHTLSGGERQRTAVARAVVHGPQVVFADEPTGS
ncbi:MAG: ATP-binding cassette domain-containing protein, partial [Bifidobacteriaceae bacterium]|nr:ATP-binding cassette domain-containing protein [Bifidobacteriaceae bacterium]